MNDDLNKKIEKLERRLEREKNARKEAEKLLEERSREIFLSNEDLKQQISEAKFNQTQLSFLMGLSADVWNADSINNIVKVYLNRSSEFLSHSQSVFFQLELINGENRIQGIVRLDTNQSLDTREKDSGDKKSDAIGRFVESVKFDTLREKMEEGNLESQLLDISVISDKECEFSYVFVVPVFEIKKSTGFACFLYKDEEFINIFKLQTMESSRGMLTIAIQRKLGAINLERRYAELKQTYEKLDDAQKQLMQSEKMASLGQMAAGVAHEINNPIGFILSNYETLTEYVGVVNDVLGFYPNIIESGIDKESTGKLAQIWKDEDIDYIRQDISDILNSSKNGLVRVQDIVAGLKSFSHSDTGSITEMDINHCVEDSIQLVWNELKYDYDVERNLASETLIKGNEGQLQQVIVNMLINAKQAMPDGGKITLTTSLNNKGVELIITDTGCGMDQATIDKLFTPFFTTKPVGVGTGLGMSISYGIIQEHNATIEVKSKKGEGTSFVIQFPKLNAGSAQKQ